MLIYNYNNFLFEAEDDKKHFLVLSPKFKKLLNKINSPISSAILRAETDDSSKYEISFLDYVEDKDKNDRLTFLPSVKLFQNPEFLINPENAWISKTRQEMGIGRIVNKLFPDKFKQTDIEKFVNDYKAEISKSFADFRLVEGEDVRKYYLEDNYENTEQGDINSSCMRYPKAQPWLDIYAKNPEKCKLLILMSDKVQGKIKGRALVWMGTRKPTGKIYLDRIYIIHDKDEKLYIDYAIEHGWLYKAQQVMHDASYIENGKRVYSSVAIQLNPIKFDHYPSMDTLQYYTPTTGRLGSNAGNYVPGHSRYHLDHADGGSSKMDNNK